MKPKNKGLQFLDAYTDACSNDPCTLDYCKHAMRRAKSQAYRECIEALRSGEFLKPEFNLEKGEIRTFFKEPTAKELADWLEQKFLKR